MSQKICQKKAFRQFYEVVIKKAYEAGVIITGGHTIHDQEPKYGLSVSGFVHPQNFLTNSGARPGDILILTKPLGVGILTTSAKAEFIDQKSNG